MYKIKAIYKKTNDDIKSSKLALDIANSDYILYKNAYKDGSVTSKDFMNAKNNLTIASKKYKKAIDRNNEVNKELENIISKNEYQNSEIEQLTEEIKGLQTIVSSGTIISPTDGKIKNLKIKPDNHINSGDEILTIVQN